MDLLHVILVISHVCYCVVGQTFLTQPKNAAVVLQGTVVHTLVCSTEANTPTRFMSWEEKKLRSSDQTFQQITQGDTVLPNKLGYELDTDLVDVKYNLKLAVNETSWAGDYGCKAATPSTAYRYAKITVLESDPQCTANVSTALMDGESVLYTCQVAYSGELVPKMQWSSPIEAIEDDIDDSIDGSLVKFSIVVVATIKKNNWQYTCRTYFDPLVNPDTGYDKDAPNYSNRHITEKIIVHWGPRNQSISPPKPEFYPRENLTCTGNSNPPIDYYKWTDVTDNNKTLQEGSDASVLMVRDEWVEGGSRVLRCTIRNTVRDGPRELVGDEFTIGVFTTTVPPTTTTTTAASTSTTEPTSTTPSTGEAIPTDRATSPLDTGAIIGIVVGCIAVLIIVLLLVYCFCIRTSPTKEQEANNTRPPKPIPADQVRRPDPIDLEKNNLTPAPYGTTTPPPYNPPYDNADPYRQQPLDRNVEGLVYADLALDDTPRSRKPIQFPMDADQTIYTDVRPSPGPMV